MPIYEYVCRSCRRKFETLVKDSSASVRCECGSEDTERQLSVFAAASTDPARHCAGGDHCPAAGTHACGRACCSRH